MLGLPERLPHHPGFTGKGVTIAFLDSGYYPHPDLTVEADPDLDIASPQTDVARLRRLLERKPMRLRQYVNITEGAIRTGLDAASLWSDAPNSWHGQMTTVLAAGNGQLSHGRYRGLAPEADLLPIKIGRPNGSIPESEILAGLRWLLQDDNWERYGVRVLNVSVGGDFPQPWWENDVCLAVEELSRRGVLVTAAAGNSNQKMLLAPAQAPSALTVGGLNDYNRRWRADRSEEVVRLGLYHHNWGDVHVDSWLLEKPELVAPSVWLPSPFLPVSPLFRQMWAVGLAWEALEMGNVAQAREVMWRLHSALNVTAAVQTLSEKEARRALRFLMNPHKWVHAHYQHVDGTSVAAPLAAAAAAQMFQANPHLNAHQVKKLLTQSAMPLPHLPRERAGHGLLRPSVAVALALRAPGGPLAGLPVSGTLLGSGQKGEARDAELHKYGLAVKVASSESEIPRPTGAAVVYLGLSAPHARSVSLIGSFNNWRPGQLTLEPAKNGWWHGLFRLPPGSHTYRFWVEDAETGEQSWLFDAENPLRAESGFPEPHSVVHVSGP